MVAEGKIDEAVTEIVRHLKSKGSKEPLDVLKRRVETFLNQVQKIPGIQDTEIRPGMEGFHQEQDRLTNELKRKGVRIIGEQLKGDLAEQVSEFEQRMSIHQQNFGQAIEQGNYGFALNSFTNLMKAYIEPLKIRDPAIRERLQAEINERLKEKKGKNERIFVRLGEFHTLPFQELRRIFAGNPRVQIRRNFDRQPTQFFPDDALARKMIMTPKKVAKEDYVKAMFGAVVQSAMIQTGHQNEKYISRIANTAAQTATIKDIQEVFKVINPKRPESFYEAVQGYLRFKRIIQ
ncbi:MAG: hypothetical protein Q7S92_05510 [Candidatus Diapherotrites archaeon]|nr:hypothetical protein [Candidatus Diapherotrites archaeon]